MDPLSPGFHSLSILPISAHEFNVMCENTRCDFNETAPTRLLAKDAALKHLRELIAQEG